MTKAILKNIRAGLGFIYFLFNAVFFAAFAILIAGSVLTGHKNPGFLMLAFPGLGLAAGSWIRHGRFGWWRIPLIIISLLCSAGIIYLGFFMPAVLKK